MLRVIIDTNSLQSEELTFFLRADRRHIAALPEHIASEIFRPNSVAAIIESFSVLSQFPRQVLMLWGNAKATGIDPRRGGMADSLIDKPTTRQLPTFFDILRRASEGNLGYREQLLKRRAWAVERSDNVLSALGDQSEVLAEIRSNFAPADLKRLARGESLSDEGRATIIAIVSRLASDQTRQVAGRGLAGPPHRYKQFAWRYSLCHIIQLIEMIRTGAVRRAPIKARNDHFDNVIATFGTYFNGVMSNDRGALRTHAIARAILHSLEMPLAVDYMFTDHFEGLLAGN